MQSELQPRVHNTSGENMLKKNNKNAEKTPPKNSNLELFTFCPALQWHRESIYEHRIVIKTYTLPYHFLSQSFT